MGRLETATRKHHCTFRLPSQSWPIKKHSAKVYMMSKSAYPRKALTAGATTDQRVSTASLLPVRLSLTFFPETVKVKWYRGTLYNATILGLCNFCAPGLWGAMNSLGAGGALKPYLVNTANALTFCLMVVTCYLSSIVTKYIGLSTLRLCMF